MKVSKFIAGAALAAFAGTALAGNTSVYTDTLPTGGVTVYDYTGQLNAGSSTWQRPTETFTVGGGSLERFSANNAITLAAGPYDFFTVGTAPAGWDTFLHLYSSFNSAAPTTGGIAGDDDGTTPLGTGSIFSATVNAGTYTLVNSEFSVSGANRDFRTVVRTGNERIIPDNNAVGRTRTINVAETGAISSLNSVTIRGLQHTWMGDLVITLSHGGQTIDLLDRFGATTAGGVGEDSGMNGDYTFALGGAAFADLLDTANQPAGTYAPFANGTVGQTSPATGTFGSLVGLDVGGAWTLNVQDRASLDTGMFVSWEIDVSYVPTPGAAALAGIAGLAGLRRRRA